MWTVDDLLSVARGERDWTYLRSHGLDVHRQEDGWMIGAVNGPTVRLSKADVDAGEDTYKSDRAARREWASFLLACDAYEFAEHDADDAAKADQLWDLAFGEG